MTQMTKGDGGPIRFFVDGVEQTSRFGRYANESLSFCCGPVLAFGGKGATLSKSRREWRIHSGDVVVASTDGLVAMGANEGVLYQVEKECLVGSKAVIRLDLPGRQETIEGSELIYRIPDQSVEVRP